MGKCLLELDLLMTRLYPSEDNIAKADYSYKYLREQLQVWEIIKKYIFEDYTSFDLYKGDSSVWIEFTIPALNQKITNKYNEYSREEIKEDKLLQKWIKKEIKDYERN